MTKCCKRTILLVHTCEPVHYFRRCSHWLFQSDLAGDDLQRQVITIFKIRLSKMGTFLQLYPFLFQTQWEKITNLNISNLNLNSNPYSNSIQFNLFFNIIIETKKVKVMLETLRQSLDLLIYKIISTECSFLLFFFRPILYPANIKILPNTYQLCLLPRSTWSCDLLLTAWSIFRINCKNDTIRCHFYK